MTSKMARPTSSRAEGTHSGSSTSIKAATDIHISWRTWAVAKPLSSPHLISEAPPSFVCYGGGGCRRKGIYTRTATCQKDEALPSWVSEDER